MRAGDVLRVDFGVPVGSTPGLIRPAIVVTADPTLEVYDTTVHVVPVTSNVSRNWPTDVELFDVGFERRSVAQCHLLAVIDVSQVLDGSGPNIGTLLLTQIRSTISTLLDCPVG